MKTVKNYQFGSGDSSSPNSFITSAVSYQNFNNDGSSIFLWENSAWDPLPSIYLEMVVRVSSGTGYVTLWNITDNTQVIGSELSITNTGYQRFRVGPFTLPANDLKEFKIYGKTSGGTLTLLDCRLLFIQSGTIKKTVSYIPLRMGTASYYNKLLWEPTKYTDISGIYFEGTIVASASTVFDLYDGTNPVTNSPITFSAGPAARQRSPALSLTAGAQYIARFTSGTLSTLEGFHLIIKQVSASQISITQTIMTFVRYRDAGATTTYALPTLPVMALYAPAEWDSINSAYFECYASMFSALGSGNVKLRNLTNALDITGSEINITTTAALRVRSGDISGSLPTASKELGIFYRISDASYPLTVFDAYFIINQQGFTESIEVLMASLATRKEELEILKVFLEATYPQSIDVLKVFLHATGTWGYDILKTFLHAREESLDVLKVSLGALGSSIDILKVYVATRDIDGPFVSGARVPAPGSIVPLNQQISFPLEDTGWGVDLDSAWVELREWPYHLNPAVNSPTGVTRFTKAGLTAPGQPTGTPSGTGGNIATGTYYYKIAAVNKFGESALGVESQAVAVTGPTGSVALSWTAVTGATSYRVYRTTTAGSYSSPALVGAPSTNSMTDTLATPNTGAPATTIVSSTPFTYTGDAKKYFITVNPGTLKENYKYRARVFSEDIAGNPGTSYVA